MTFEDRPVYHYHCLQVINMLENKYRKDNSSSILNIGSAGIVKVKVDMNNIKRAEKENEIRK